MGSCHRPSDPRGQNHWLPGPSQKFANPASPGHWLLRLRVPSSLHPRAAMTVIIIFSHVRAGHDEVMEFLMTLFVPSVTPISQMATLRLGELN